MIKPEQFITLSSSVGLNPIIACIGSTKILSDCFGPIVGQLLVDKYQIQATVIGTLYNPLHAVNLIPRMREAIELNPNGKIIAVDAFESKDNKDSVKIINGGIKPGLASGKDLPRIGNLSIIASTYKYNGNFCCLGRIYSMADKVAKLISLVVNCGISQSLDNNTPPNVSSTTISTIL